MLTVIGCVFKSCKSGNGGAIKVYQSNTSISDCIFIWNYAKNSGAVSIGDSRNTTVVDSQFIENKAKRFGAMHLDGHDETNYENIKRTNFSHNMASVWIGGVRLQHNGGEVEDCCFEGNTANEYGALWDYGHMPGVRIMARLAFFNNSAKAVGAGFTAYHLNFQGKITNSIFVNNRNENGFKGNSIYLHSDFDLIKIKQCEFDQKMEEALLVYFNDTSQAIVEESGFGK